MKKILFIFIAVLISIAGFGQTTYYVATAANGGDDANDGSVGSPWLTVDSAAYKATTIGDIIYVTAGSYTEPNRIELSPGVSILGVGDASVINSTYHPGSPNSTDGSIYGLSGSVTDGNQSISYIKLTGSDTTALYAVFFENRNNVSVHHCTIENFRDRGVTFYAAPWTTGVYATGNKIYNCTIRNSSSRGVSGGGGLIQINGQSTMEIHDNILNAIDGAAGYCGQIMTAITGWNKGIKYYNNKSYTPETNGTQWNFHLETWNGKGGWEIYDNEFYGGGVGVDIAGSSNIKGTYDYSFYVHNNLFQRAATQPINMSRESVAIAIEGASTDVIITKNLFKYCQFGVVLSLAQVSITQERIYVYYNIFENTGVTNNDWGGPFQIRLSANNDIVDSIFYENNVLTASSTAASGVYSGLLLSMDNNDTGQSITNIFVRNNIIEGFLNGPIAVYDTTVVTSLTNTHNIVYNNGNSNDIHYYNGQSSVTSYIVSDTLKRDPRFISTSNFRLQGSSPAINAGTDVSLTSDYDGNPIVGIPDIGAFEYQTLPVPVTGLGWEDHLAKRNFKDDVNFAGRWMIDAIPVTATAAELNALVGQGQIISGLDTINLSNRINAKADTSLSNLGVTAINEDLLPEATNTINLGSDTYKFKTLYVEDAIELGAWIDSANYYTKIYNVLDYGATGDGAADDVTFIQAAIDACNIGDGGIVSLPEGTYIISTSLILKSNVTLLGQGKGITIIKAIDTWPFTRLNYAMITFIDNSINMRIESLTLDGNKSAHAGNRYVYGIYTYNKINLYSAYIEDFEMVDVEIKETSAWGVALSAANDIHIRESYIHHTGLDSATAGGLFISGVNRFQFINNIVDSSYRQAMYLLNGSNAIISNSRFSSSSTGGGIDCRIDSAAIISNNICEYNASMGLILQMDPVYNNRTRSINVIGNIIRHNSPGANYQSRIYNSEDVLYSGNHIETYDASTTHYGLQIDESVRNITIESNTIIAPSGIYIEEDTLVNIIVRNNTITSKTDYETPQSLNYGINLNSSKAASDGIYILNNVIGSCIVGINIGTGWLANNTVIKGNEIKNAVNYRYYDRSVSTNRYYAPEYETRKVKIGLAGVANKDFNLPNDADEDEYVITLSNYIPPYSRVTSIELMCITTLAGTGATDMNWEIGSSSSGNQYIESVDCDYGADVRGIIKVVTEQGRYNTAGSIYVTADPVGANWSTFTGGAWILYVTYLRLPGSLY